jgi:hypothetical protein
VRHIGINGMEISRRPRAVCGGNGFMNSGRRKSLDILSSKTQTKVCATYD